jgi:hypothetical protein
MDSIVFTKSYLYVIGHLIFITLVTKLLNLSVKIKVLQTPNLRHVTPSGQVCYTYK